MPPERSFSRHRHPRRLWLALALLLALSGLLLHPLAHHQPQSDCVLCLIGSGGSPLPSSTPPPPVPPVALQAPLPLPAAPALFQPSLRTRPPTRAPPSSTPAY